MILKIVRIFCFICKAILTPSGTELAKNELKRRKVAKLKEEEQLRRLAAEAEAKRLAEQRAALEEHERLKLEKSIQIQAMYRGYVARKESALKKKMELRR